MTGRELALMVKDILNEYRLLEDSPMQGVEWISTHDEENRPLEPFILLHLFSGAEFEVHIVQKK